MSDLEPSSDRSKNLVAIEDLPKSVVQGLYHAVTGKTETLSSTLKGNVIITGADLDRLHDMILTQISIHELVTSPTVTIVIKHENSKSYTYSSWIRFKELCVGNFEVTSEVTLKYEFLLQIPLTPKPQRCVVNLNIDSSLPVLKNRDEHISDIDPLGFSFFVMRDWNTVLVSIDFVDFLIAKSFSGVVEEWFKSLPRLVASNLEVWIRANQATIFRILQQVGRVGLAIFLIAFVTFSAASDLSARNWRSPVRSG